MYRDSASNQLIDYKNNLASSVGTITTGCGNPVGIQDASLSVGTKGPLLLQDAVFLEEIDHFARERIPERVVCAKGAGAFGYFEVTHDITKYCAVKMFERIKKRTPIACRFSNYSGEVGSPDTMRDTRGFSVKFYTEEGIWDLVGQNSPVFFIRDPILFPSLIHSQKRNPQTNLKDPDMFWDFATLRAECIYQLCFMFGDRGIPDGYRHMHGYGTHCYKLVNAHGEPIFAKFHFRTDQGVQNLDVKKAAELMASDPDYAARDLFNSIKNANYPSWSMYVQFMTCEEIRKFKYNAFDCTKIWPYSDSPLIPVGRIVLDRNPCNYFAEIEQIAFNPANMVPGIEPSPDKMLQARIFAYSEAQRHRLGTNFQQIPVNCPFAVNVKNYQRNGPMTVTCNQGGAPNYYPNSFSGPEICPRAQGLLTCCKVAGDVYRFGTDESDDNFSQATDFWVLVLDECARKRLVDNIACNLSCASTFIQERAIKNFTMVHVDFGRMMTEALNISKMSRLSVGNEEEGEEEA